MKRDEEEQAGPSASLKITTLVYPAWAIAMEQQLGRRW
jgi:hypothetical protein